LLRFFDNPLKEFAQQRLNLKFENNDQSIDDAEPFVTHALNEYQIRDEFCQALLSEYLNKESDKNTCQTIRLSHELSGRLPESPLTKVSLDQWEKEALFFSQAVRNKGEVNSSHIILKVGNIAIQAELPWLIKNEQLLLWRPAKRNAKDDMRLWLCHLLASVYSELPIRGNRSFRTVTEVLAKRLMPALFISR